MADDEKREEEVKEEEIVKESSREEAPETEQETSPEIGDEDPEEKVEEELEEQEVQTTFYGLGIDRSRVPDFMKRIRFGEFFPTIGLMLRGIVLGAVKLMGDVLKTFAFGDPRPITGQSVDQEVRKRVDQAVEERLAQQREEKQEKQAKKIDKHLEKARNKQEEEKKKGWKRTKLSQTVKFEKVFHDHGLAAGIKGDHIYVRNARDKLGHEIFDEKSAHAISKDQLEMGDLRGLYDMLNKVYADRGEAATVQKLCHEAKNIAEALGIHPRELSIRGWSEGEKSLTIHPQPDGSLAWELQAGDKTFSGESYIRNAEDVQRMTEDIKKGWGMPFRMADGKLASPPENGLSLITAEAAVYTTVMMVNPNFERPKDKIFDPFRKDADPGSAHAKVQISDKESVLTAMLPKNGAMEVGNTAVTIPGMNATEENDITRYTEEMMKLSKELRDCKEVIKDYQREEPETKEPEKEVSSGEDVNREFENVKPSWLINREVEAEGGILFNDAVERVVDIASQRMEESAPETGEREVHEEEIRAAEMLDELLER